MKNSLETRAPGRRRSGPGLAKTPNIFENGLANSNLYFGERTPVFGVTLNHGCPGWMSNVTLLSVFQNTLRSPFGGRGGFPLIWEPSRFVWAVSWQCVRLRNETKENHCHLQGPLRTRSRVRRTCGEFGDV